MYTHTHTNTGFVYLYQVWWWYFMTTAPKEGEMIDIYLFLIEEIKD